MKDIEQIEEPYLIDTSKETLKEEKEWFFQIDFLKAVMIFLVIFDHMVHWNIKSEIGVTLWERISIPVFLVIMGFNMGKSFQQDGDLSLKELYSWGYFKHKILRYILPFLVLYAASTFIGLFMYGFNLSNMWYGQFYPNHGFIHLFIGFLPFWGPGNWFIPLLFQSILILPLLYWAFRKKPVLTLIICFVVEVALQLMIFFTIGNIGSYEEYHILYLIITSALFYLPSIGLGMWFSFDHDLKSKRNVFMWILFPISLAFIIMYQFFGYRIRIDGVLLLRGDYHFLIIPYSAFLFLLALRFLPQKSEQPISRAITLIGKSTYHILLTQILGYGMIFAFWGTHYIIDIGFQPDQALDLIIAWILFISFGVMWYKIDQQKSVLRRVLSYFNLFIVFSSILFLTFWAQELWIPIPLVIIIIYGIAAFITNFIIQKPLNTKILAFWTQFVLITFIMMVLQVEVMHPSEFWISFIFIIGSFIVALIGTILDTMRIRELFWGFFFLLSAFFILFISIYKFSVYMAHIYILLFEVWEYVTIIGSVIIALVAFKATVNSFYFSDIKPIKWYIKVIVIGAVIYSMYNISLIFEILSRW
ncbi:MAG: acyltransferase family protein [Promethearchaeota archaeon]